MAYLGSQKSPQPMYAKEEQRHLYDLSKKLLQAPEPQDTATATASALRQVILYHEWRYYALNDPVISDYEYDMLYKKLQTIEARFPELVTPDSPTQRVSSDLTEEFATVEHLTPMLSLDNSYDAEDLKDFDERIKNYLGLPLDLDIEYCVEPKFDGGTIALVYENDQLVRAATRGNGALGDEITANIRTLRSVPLRAEFSKFGIAYLRKCTSSHSHSRQRTRNTCQDKFSTGKPRNKHCGSIFEDYRTNRLCDHGY